MTRNVLSISCVALLAAMACEVTGDDDDNNNDDDGGAASSTGGRSAGAGAGSGTGGAALGGNPKNAAGADAGGQPGDAGSGGEATAGMSGGPGGTDAGGAGGAGGGATSSSDVCGSAEARPNEDRTTATPYAFGTVFAACLQDAADFDYYEFTTPATNDGGYVQVSVTDVDTTGNVSLHIWSASDNGEVLNTYSPTRGASQYLFFNAEPGATFRLAVTSWSSAVDTAYQMRTTFTPVLDIHEPNDLRTTATPIALDQVVTGYFFAGHANAAIPTEAWFDWYKVELAAGALTGALAVNAPDVRGSVRIFDALGTQVDYAYSPTAGSTVPLTYVVPAAGTYYLRVEPWTEPLVTGTTVAVPPYLTQPYTLTLTQ